MSKIIQLFLLFVVTFFTNCKKDLIEVTLPDDVNLGESVIYLNGEITTDYKPDFRTLSVYKILSFPFVFQQSPSVTTALGFDYLPVSTGEFILSTERVPHIHALTSLFQVVDEDLEGTEFKLFKPEDGFFNIEALDTVKMEVKGRFRARFKRTDKNGNRGNLPKYMQFDGVFYEKYRVI